MPGWSRQTISDGFPDFSFVSDELDIRLRGSTLNPSFIYPIELLANQNEFRFRVSSTGEDEEKKNLEHSHETGEWARAL